MTNDIREHLLRDAIDLQLYIKRKVQSLFDILIRVELSIRDILIEQELERSNEPDIFQDRRTQIFADTSDLCRHSFDLVSKLSIIDHELVAADHQVAQIGECLIMKIACDASTFAFGFIR